MPIFDSTQIQQLPMPGGQDPRQALLSQMHDLQLPEAIGWFPPAPGWIALFLLLLMALTGLLLWLVQRRRQRRYRHQALAALAAIESAREDGACAQCLATMRLLKRVYFTAYPDKRSQDAGLFGRDWLQRLAASCQRPLAVDEVGEFIEAALYQAKMEPSKQQMRFLFDTARRWIRHHQPAPQHRLPQRRLPQRKPLMAQTEAQRV